MSGIPQDMRRTTMISLSGHLMLLAVLTAIPLLKVPSQNLASYQVTLVATPILPPPVEASPTPVEKEPAATEPPPAQVRMPAPVAASPIGLKPRERLSDSLKETLQGIALPKKVAPAVPSARQEPVLAKGLPQRDFYEMLKKADESFHGPPVIPVVKPAAPPSIRATTPETSEEIGKLLSGLSPPVTVQQSPRPPVVPLAMHEERLLRPKESATVMAAVPPGSPSASRAATLERCPQKAQKYCPLLEAAINRVWNADTNPGVRQVLESAGDSTTTVRIVIQPNGEIREIRINTSSGNEPYDRAVQSVLREIRSLPPLPEEMRDEPFVAITSFTYTRKRDS